MKKELNFTDIDHNAVELDFESGSINLQYDLATSEQ